MPRESGPDDVLRSLGLTRAGLVYVLDAERGFLEGLTRIQPRYAELLDLYRTLSAAVQNRADYDRRENDYAILTEHLKNVGILISDHPTTNNSDLKQSYRALLDEEIRLIADRNALDRELNLRWKSQMPDSQREKLFAEFQEKRLEFAKEARSLR